MKAKKLFTILTILTLGITNLWGTSYIPGDRKVVTADETIDYATIAGANATTSGKWIVNPRGGTTSGKKYTNLTTDTKGNPDGIVDNIATITSNVNMATIQVPSTAKYNQNGKYVIHMRITGITGIIAHGVTGSSGRGCAIYGQEYSTSLTENTEYGSALASMTRSGNSGSFLLQYTGFTASKEYLITIAATGGDDQLYAIELIAGATTKHSVTYVLGDGTGTTPTQADVAEGAKFTLHDGVTDITPPASTKVFAGWNDGSSTYAGGAEYTMGTSDVTLTAQWSDKYTVTYDKNGGDGTMADTYNEIVACTFTAPDGKAFKEWNTQADGNGTTYAVGASVTSDLDLFAIWVNAPTVVFYYQWTGSSTAPTSNEALTATGGTFTFYKNASSTKDFQVANVTYNAAVPADMKTVAGTSDKLVALNSTTNNSYLVTLTGDKYFEEGDTVYFAGYGNFKVGSSDQGSDIVESSSALETGTGASDVKVGYFLFPAVENISTLYFTRDANSGNRGFTAVKVIRPAARTIISTVVELTSASIGDDALSASDFATLTTGPDYTYTLETKANEAPTMHFNKRTTITYDEGDPKVTNEDIAVTGTDNGAGYWQAQATINAVTYTIKVAKPATYAITYYPGANGSGSIEPGNKAEDVAFALSSERFTRAGYLQTGWATEDGGAKAYDLGGSYTANAALDLYPVWTELSTYDASFLCGNIPDGWTFSNDGFDSDSKATVASVCTFVDNGLGTPKQTTGDGTSDDDVAFAKNTDAIATYDLGIATTVAALNVTLNGGSSSAFNETIEYIGADGTTVKKEYTTSLNAGNWKDNAINKTDIVEDVRYIRVHGATKWVVMKDFSVQYIETRPQYNVEFAAGTYGTGTMATRKYIEAATVTAPDCGFGTSDATKEFDKWAVSGLAGVTELAAGETFAMPTNTVTLTALWRVATTKYTVTYYDGATELGSEEVAEGSNPAEYATYQDKANHVFLGWFNDADLAPAHAVDDISAEVIDAAANYYGKWALDLQVTKIVFSNGFDAFIDKDAKTVKAYYMAGESAPTMTSYEANANVKADGVTIVGNKVVLTGTDDSEIEYDLTIEAVTPLTTLNALQTFDGSEAYVKAGLAYDGGWKFRKNADDGRIPKGYTRIYFFVRGGAEKATFTSCATKRNVKIYVNNVETSVTETAANGSTFDVPLDPADANNMIAIVSNQTSGDGGVGALELVASAPTPDYERTGLEVGRYYTICLPKKVVAATGATFWSMSERNTDTENPLAYIVEENLPLTAGQPFLFQATATTLEVTYEGEATTAGSHGALHGTLDAMDQAALDAAAGANTLYILKNNELRLASGRTGNSLAANRAYIIYEELDPVSTPSHAPGRQVRSMPLHKDVATGLDDLNADTQAQKVLLNGQLFIIRGEKMYDATGILVK